MISFGKPWVAFLATDEAMGSQVFQICLGEISKVDAEITGFSTNA